MRLLIALAALSLVQQRSGRGAGPAAVVNVYNWSDYIDPTVIDEFTKNSSITVRYDTFDSNDTLETKLLAGKSGYDVVAPTAYFSNARSRPEFSEARQVEIAEPRQWLARDHASAR
jgi:putrescine transport system substrate-binding protein